MSFYFDESILESTPGSRDEMVEYVELLYQLIEDGHFEENGPEFIYYLSITSPRDSREVLDSEEIDTSIEVENVRYASFISFIINRATSHRNMDAYEEYKIEFDDRDLFPYLESWYHLLTRFGANVEDKIAASISNGLEALKNNPENFFVQYQFADAVKTGIDEVENYQIIESEISLEKDELLEKATQKIERALQLHPGQSTFPEGREAYVSRSMCYAVLAQLKAFAGEFEAARISLNESRKNFEESWGILEKEELTQISLKIDALSLENNISDFRSRIESLRSEIDGVQQELEETTERFRSDIVQYIAFFAGVITIAVVSAQVSQLTASFQEAAMLILVFSGGLLVAFGGFSLMLPYKLNKQSIWVRFFVLLLLGTGLIMLGIDVLNLWK